MRANEAAAEIQSNVAHAKLFEEMRSRARDSRSACPKKLQSRAMPAIPHEFLLQGTPQAGGGKRLSFWAFFSFQVFTGVLWAHFLIIMSAFLASAQT